MRPRRIWFARALELIGGDLAAVLLLDGDVLRFVAEAGHRPDVGPTLPMSGTLAGRMLEHDQSVLLEDIDRQEGFEFTRAAGIRSGIGVPLKHRDRKVVVTQYLHPDDHAGSAANFVRLIAG